MEKILTVSIAAYNVANYIDETLKSCILDDNMDDLEVLIVDDGAKDNTAEIAQKYVDKYPNTFRLIRKENGGYGTTINSGVQNANGKYFKLLDGDDYFDNKSLGLFIEKLKAENADMVITKNVEISSENNEKALPQRAWYKYMGCNMAISEMADNTIISMWNTAVKTELIKNNPYEYPKRFLYTDSLFVINALSRSQSISFYDLELYYYRVDRIGQSTNINSIINHRDDMLQVYYLAKEILEKQLYQNESKNIVICHVAMTYLNYISAKFWYEKRSGKARKDLIAFEKECKDANKDIYLTAAKMSKRLNMNRRTGYLAYFI